jgi:DNA-binding transcriptional MerR regulator
MSSPINIAAVSKLVGLPVETLRNWERRYDFLRPTRNKAGTRLYDRKTVLLLKRVSQLLQQGMRIGDIADLLQKGLPLPTFEKKSRMFAGELEAFYEKLITMDLCEADRMLSYLEDQLTKAQILDQVFTPVLNRIGEDWQSGLISVAREHFCSTYIRQQMAASLVARRNSGQDPETNRVVCTTLPGEKHEGGLLVLSNHFQIQRWNVFHLGTETPMPALKDFCSRVNPDIVCLSFTSAGVLEENLAALSELEASIFAGGRAFCDYETNTRSGVHILKNSGQKAVNEIIQRWQALGSSEKKSQ